VSALVATLVVLTAGVLGALKLHRARRYAA
jgi:Tfp pilus assembly protein PilV